MRNIFIHGWGFSNSIWKSYSYLDDSTFVELPYHGKSTSKQETLMDFSKEISKNITKPTTIIGWSIGATVAIMVALNNPYVERMILIGFSPKFSDKTLGSDPKTVKAFLFNLNRDYDETVNLFRKTAIESSYDEDLPQKEGAIKLLRDYVKTDLTGALKDIKAKTYILHGTNDKIVNMNASFYCKENIKGSEIILLNSHHGPFLDWDIFEFIDE